ncbi:SUKH-4 family immunity protein [Actinoplanes sp. Pm04-4]|uniref:SUKH-4 family immunity protein n=1 Tax=Paractinoplanes pyxinae TaxID=2997416 RepID=A0ABT4B600_9ACTN|nr:SUKH-4 family immunity protein [Actinoplanes pyxinae]MCY1141462.1 SUKH-4 family immunity protein [Actinoplanes pyxinae]
MSDREILQEFHQFLTASLDDLVDASSASMGLPQIVERWAIPSEHKVFVLTYGVPIEQDPDGLQLRGDVQWVTDPEVAVSGRLGYRLGSDWGRTLAAMAPSGEVWAVRSPLDPRYSIRTAVAQVNSSVTAFIDLSWRWHTLRPLLLALGYRDAFFDAAEAYLARLTEIDEALMDEKEYPWWRDLILDW